MTRVFRGFPASGIVAVFDEPNTTGAWNDINASRNGPAKTPASFIDTVYLHSRYNYFVPASGFPLSKTISHVLYAADTGTAFGIATSFIDHDSADYKLADHGLGAVPVDWMVAANGIEYPVGCPIQVGAGGGRRSISFWADATSLWVHEDVKPGAPGLPALSVTYYVVVYRPTGDDPGAALFSGPSPMQMGRGRIKSTEHVLRDVQSGDSNVLSIQTADSGDLVNGHFRHVLLDSLSYDVGPIIGKDTYTGSFWGGPQKQVAVSS